MDTVTVGAHVATSSSDVTLWHVRYLHQTEHLTSHSKRKIGVALVWDAYSKFDRTQNERRMLLLLLLLPRCYCRIMHGC